MDEVGPDSATLMKTRTSFCRVWYAPGEMLRRGHSGCNIANYNKINSYWSQDCGEVGSDGEELLVEEHHISA